MVALILAPGTFSRNKFFSLFEDDTLREARRRAQMVRSLVKDLTEPWKLEGEIPSHPTAVEVREHTVEGAEDEPTRVLSFRVPEFNYRREAHLTSLEAAALRYCLSRAKVGDISAGDKRLVEQHLHRLSPLLT